MVTAAKISDGAAKGKPRGRPFAPGQSGNPKGRKAGARGKRGRELLSQLEPHGSVLLAHALAVATNPKATDSAVLRDLLSRCLPPIPRSYPVQFELPAGTLVEQSAAVLRAVAAGELTIDEGKQLADAIASHAKVVEVHEFAERLARIEAQMGGHS